MHWRIIKWLLDSGTTMISNGYNRMILHPINLWDDYPELACTGLTSRTHQRMLSESSCSTSDGYKVNWGLHWCLHWCPHCQHVTEFCLHGEAAELESGHLKWLLTQDNNFEQSWCFMFHTTSCIYRNDTMVTDSWITIKLKRIFWNCRDRFLLYFLLIL